MKALFYGGPQDGREMHLPYPPSTIVVFPEVTTGVDWQVDPNGHGKWREHCLHHYRLLSHQKYVATYFYE